jgi:hypothetical protein
MTDDFWATIRAQLKELETAKNADDVARILAHERNPYGPEWDGAAGGTVGFFAGSGGDNTVANALETAGWDYVWAAASYHYCMKASDGSMITYVEGDIYAGNPANQRPSTSV